jgi:hypothetical protein
MAGFRHPRTHNERKADQALLHEGDGAAPRVKTRVRSGKRGGKLPTERSDLFPAALSDRGRGKRGPRDQESR